MTIEDIANLVVVEAPKKEVLIRKALTLVGIIKGLISIKNIISLLIDN
jgi:hypothetical protein